MTDKEIDLGSEPNLPEISDNLTKGLSIENVNTVLGDELKDVDVSLNNRENDFMIVTVDAPFKQGEGMNAFTSYKVNTKTNLTTYKYGNMTTVRRYSDFHWLHEQLEYEYPGIFIPPIPEKAVLGRFSPEFVVERQKSLEKFLQRVSCHTILRYSRYLRIFLGTDDTGLTMAKEESKLSSKGGSSGGSGGGGFLSWISSSVSSVAASFSSYEPALTEADIEFEEMKSYINGLSQFTEDVYKKTNSLLIKRSSLGDGLMDFGLSFAYLGKHEGGGTKLGSALLKFGKTADILYQSMKLKTEREISGFENKLHDYTQLIASVQRALAVRDDRCQLYHKACYTCETAQAALNKLHSVASTDASKLDGASDRVVKCEADKVAIEKDVEVISQRIRDEMIRFNANKVIDIKKILQEYVSLQIDYCDKSQEAWRSTLPDLEAIGASSSSNSGETYKI